MANKDSNQQGRISPNSIESEESVLGCMLISNSAVSKVVDALDANSFYSNPNSIIFTNIVELFNENSTIDYITLNDKLKKKKKIDIVGGAYYITGLSTKAPSAVNIDYYIQIVKEKAILRHIINVGADIASEAFDSQQDAVNILDKAEQTLFSISQKAQK